MRECQDLAEWASDIEREIQERADREQAGRKAEEARRRDEQRRLDDWFPVGPRAERQTWDTYEPQTPRQAATRDQLRLWAERGLGGDGRGWYCMGPVGVGKSHLAHAVANTFRARTAPVLAVSVPAFLARIRATYDAKASDDGGAIEAAAARVPLLILDDLGSERPTEWALERLFLLIDRRYELCLATGITTNWKPKDLQEMIGPRIVSRLLEMCDLMTLDGDDFRVGRAKNRGRSL